MVPPRKRHSSAKSRTPSADPAVAQLLAIIDAAYDRKSWHGTNLRGSVRRVTAQQAAWRPAPGRHCIWELVVHAAYWKYIGLRRLTGAKKGSFPLKGSDFFARGDNVSEAAWQEDIALMDRTHADYELAAECMSAGGPISGVAALVVSTSPATTILENQIRCGPIAERGTAPTLDTITIRQDRSVPFSAKSLTGVVLVWAPETQESETRADRTHFDYAYYAYLENGLATATDVVATVALYAGVARFLDLFSAEDTVFAARPDHA